VAVAKIFRHDAEMVESTTSYFGFRNQSQYRSTPVNKRVK